VLLSALLVGRLWAGCMLGSDLKPGSITVVTDRDCWECIYRAISWTSAHYAVHPNKAWMSLFVHLQGKVLDPGAIQLLSAPKSAFQTKHWKLVLLVCRICFSPGRLTQPSRPGRQRMLWATAHTRSPVTQSRCSNTASFRARRHHRPLLRILPARSAESAAAYRRKFGVGPNGPDRNCALPT